MTVEKVMHLLHQRPSPEDFREQLFWLVDLVYACKASEDAVLAEQAKLLEEALSHLGNFLENGDKQALTEAGSNIESFTKNIEMALHAKSTPTPP